MYTFVLRSKHTSSRAGIPFCELLCLVCLDVIQFLSDESRGMNTRTEQVLQNLDDQAAAFFILDRHRHNTKDTGKSVSVVECSHP